MNCRKIILVALAIGSAWIGPAAEYSVDARSGVVFSAADGDFYIRSNAGGGSGIALQDQPTTTIRSLHHDTIVCDAVVKFALAQTLKCSALYVSQAGAVLEFLGGGSQGVATPSGDQELLLDVGAGSRMNLEVPIMATRLLKRGGGDVLSSESVSAQVANEGGTVYFASGKLSNLGLQSDVPFVFHAVSAEASPVSLTVDRADNDGVGISAKLASLDGGDEAWLSILSVGGGHDVSIGGAQTLLQLDVAENPAYYADAVPECVVVGSNSVGVLRVDGKMLAKLAIADGELSAAKGAVYIGADAVVTNCSASMSEPLLGRSGYACLDVAGDYTAYGSWLGAVAGQLSLTVTGSFRHPDSSERACGFSLGGAGASAAMTVSGGVFDAAGFDSDVALPYDLGALGVVLTAENAGLVDLGGALLTASDRVTVNVNSDATLVAGKVVTSGSSILQLNGGYLRATDGGEPFLGAAYGQSLGFGIDVPEEKAVHFTMACKPLFPSGKGVDAIALGPNVAGRKFVGPPLVVIADEDDNGEGASAVAELTSGEVTAIRVTGRGVGYVAPTAKLVYGAEEIPLGEVTISANDAGAVLKRGAGVLEVEVNTEMKGVKVYGGKVVTAIDNAFEIGPLHVAAGACLDANGTAQVFCDFSGRGSVVNGPVRITGLTIDAERVKAGDVDTLDFNQLQLDSRATIQLKNFGAFDHKDGQYVLYHTVGDIPEAIPQISEATLDAGFSRVWKVVAEDNKIILRYVGGTLYILY